jgi:hypothetical protein
MSKLLRLPLTLLAVLAALFFLPGIASADPLEPTAEECTGDPTLDGCTAPAPGDVANDAGQPEGSADQPEDLPAAGQEETAAVADQPQRPAGGAPQGAVVPAGRLAGVPAVPAAEGALTPAAVTPTPGICSLIPTFPTCPGATDPPSGPLTCDQLAELLGADGCPAGLSCQQLADLLGVTCPEGPPSCEALAELFHLEGCPAPPTSCQEFADLLGIDQCSQIPCLDTSQLPAQAREGLAPLLAGLRNIGIKECPPKPATGGGGGTGGTGTTQPVQHASTPGVYYANCDDARAHGATNIPRGTDGYRPELDGDNDGFACDETQPATAPAAQQPTGTLAYTGVDLEPLLRLSAILISGGTLLLLAGQRRT